MSEDLTSTQCSNPDCSIAAGGQCVEGLPADKCPHFGKSIADLNGVLAQTPPAPPATFDGIQLSPSTKLNSRSANSVLSKRNTKLIAIVGPRSSGKTSLIAGLYEMFQRGAVGRFTFCGSETLHAFERSCHDARSSSRRQAPDMERTSRNDLGFYHLDIMTEGEMEVVSLLLSDRAGEEYQDASDDVSNANSFSEIRCCSAILLLIDAARLLDAGMRHNLRNDVQMIVQALVDARSINRSIHLNLVLTKDDLVQGANVEARVNDDFHQLVESMTNLFSKHFAGISVFRVAASPASNAIERGAGLESLLGSIVIATEPAEINIPDLSSGRIFSRLTSDEVAT